MCIGKGTNSMSCYNRIIVAVFVSFILIIVFTGCEDFLAFETPPQYTDDGTHYGGLGSFFADGKKQEKELQSPKIRVSQGEYGNKIVIAWKAVENADYYKVFRRKKPQKGTSIPFTFIKPVVPKSVTSCIDTFLINGMSREDLNATYQYKVDVFTHKGQKNTSLYSADAYLLLPPRELKATRNFPTITVTWEESRGAKRYKVYRSEVLDSAGYALPFTIGRTLRKFVDMEESLVFGKKYYYRVVSVSASGTESIVNAHSPVSMGMRIKKSAPKPPKRVEASKATSLSEITLEWDAVSPYDNANYIRYNILRISSTSSRMITLATKIDDTEFVDTKFLEENVEYHYFVQAIEMSSDGGKLIGGYSAERDTSLAENPQTGYVLSSPLRVKMQRVNNDVHITWTKAKKATGYKVYSSNTADGSYSELSELRSSSDVTEYTDEGAASEGAAVKFYKVLSIRGDIVTSISNAKPAGIVPESPTTVEISENFYSTSVPEYEDFSGDIYPIKVTWNNAWGADSYTLWRASSEDGDYSMIEDDIHETTTAYDTSTENMEAGKYYYYKVSAKSIDDDFSDQSAASRGYGALSNMKLAQQWYSAIKNSHAKLTLMHRGGFSALGRETKRGDVSGKVKYHAEQSGIGAKIVNTYTNYADTQFLTINGSNTTEVNIRSNGNQTANYTITGMYPARITANLDINSGDASGGGYTITQDNDVKFGDISYDEVE